MFDLSIDYGRRDTSFFVSGHLSLILLYVARSVRAGRGSVSYESELRLSNKLVWWHRLDRIRPCFLSEWWRFVNKQERGSRTGRYFLCERLAKARYCPLNGSGVRWLQVEEFKVREVRMVFAVHTLHLAR